MILERLGKLTISQASRDLGISRQAIYGFKKGDYCPSLAIIERACKAWGLEFNVQGMIVNSQSFARVPTSSIPEPTQQLTFFDMWEQLENKRMVIVRAKKVKGAVEMTLRISIPA
ncbi:MAG: helix-turn-helix transcriptional regulator [Terracidiphilus sp.]